MNVLLVMAHPDDAEIWCGGLILRHIDAGDRVKICIMSYAPESLRGQEARLSADMMGCEVELFGLRDTGVRINDDAIDRLVQELITFKPNIYLTHWFDDVHPDHEATFHIARTAYFRQLLVKPVNRLHDLPVYWMCDTYGSTGMRGPFEPNQYTDVSAYWKQKISAIQTHRSQQTEFFISLMTRECLKHGRQAGVSMAEGYLRLSFFGE